MRVIARTPLRSFGIRHPDAKESLDSWYREAMRVSWSSPNDIKAAYRNASFVGNDRVIFNIRGNHYRLIVRIDYDSQIVFIRFVGTHAEYDRINAAEI